MNSRYKAIKPIDRKYYKILPWTQEKFSSESDNGVLGGDKFAISVPSYLSPYYSWYAYDGIDDYQHGWCSRTITVDVDGLTIYNPNPLKISTLEIHHFTGTVYVYRAYQGKLMGSNNGSNWTQLTSWSVADTDEDADVITLSLSLDTAYKYYKIVPIATHSNKYWGVQELYITADQIIESTESDYDFYEDVEQHKVVKETTRKYYKYVDQVWTNPIMTAQIEPGGTEFAAFMDSTYSTRYAYHMFDEQSSGAGTGYIAQTKGTLPHFLGFYNPNPVRITNITFIWYKATSGYYSPKNGQLEASNDGINYTSLEAFSYSTMPQSISFTFPSNDYYKYYRIYGTDGGVASTYACAECSASGYARTGIEEATEQDYDFYEDIEVYKAILV